jgi:hypothetical protein
MILRIQTLYFFLIFALGSILFMQNPIVNEISYRDGNQVYMEFTQFWSKAQISKESPQPLWKTDVFHCVLLSLTAISSILAVFFPRRLKIQFLLCLVSLVLSASLLSSLLVQYRLRVLFLGSNLIESLETPHLLWFGLFFAFQFSVLRILWPAVKAK